MDDATYSRTDGAITASAIKAGAVSMRLMRAEMTGQRQREPSAAMRWGDIIHAALLTPDTFAARSTIWTGGRRAGKEWEAFNAEAGGRTILTAEEWDELAAIRAVVRANKFAARMLDTGMAEVCHEWAEPLYGRAKCRRDMQLADGQWLEVKTTSATTRAAYASQHYRLGYDMQLGWYSHGTDAAQACRLLVVSTPQPHDAWLYYVPDTLLEAGYEKAAEIARRYRACEAANTFPGADGGDEFLMFEPPAWVAGGAEVEVGTGETMEASEL
jgi:hypothetical protein